MHNGVNVREFDGLIAVVVSTLDDATKPIEAPEVEVPGLGKVRPYMTELDLETSRLNEAGYRLSRTFVYQDVDRVVTIFVNVGD